MSDTKSGMSRNNGLAAFGPMHDLGADDLVVEQWQTGQLSGDELDRLSHDGSRFARHPSRRPDRGDQLGRGRGAASSWMPATNGSSAVSAWALL